MKLIKLRSGDEKMNCFRMDLKRSIFCKKFIFVVIATYLVLLASTWNEFQTSTWWGDSTGAVGSVNIISTTLAFDKFKVVIVFFLGGLYTGSYCSDENSRYLRSIFTRTTLLSYTISRFVVNFIAIMMGMLIVFILYIGIGFCAGLPLVSENIKNLYYGAFAWDHPMIYSIMMALQFGVITAACSGTGLLLSVYQPNLFVSVGMCGLVFYAATSYIPTESIFSILILLSMLPTFPTRLATPHTLMFLWGMLYPLTVYAFCAFFFARRLEWRKKHGLI
ncbi:MAG: hypothetical protein ACLTRS_08265 [Lachnospiraceae bacterium]|nr:hypothetical protein [Clostridiales bacterium]